LRLFEIDPGETDLDGAAGLAAGRRKDIELRRGQNGRSRLTTLGVGRFRQPETAEGGQQDEEDKGGLCRVGSVVLHG
jgi:hypothetical protein